MTDAFTSMKNVLSGLSLYDTDSKNIFCELKAYACTLDELKADLTQMLCECFIESAQDYGLSERELVIGAVRYELSVDKRREMLKIREGIDSSYFTLAKIKAALKSFGLEYTLYEYPSLYMVVVDTVGDYSDEQKAWITTQVQKIMPAHLSVQVIFNGPDWTSIDKNNKTFSDTDLLDYSWEEIDNLE